MVGHIGYRRTYLEALHLKARRLLRHRAGVDIDQGDARAMGRHDLAIREPQATGTAGDDHAEIGHIESRSNVHTHSSGPAATRAATG